MTRANHRNSVENPKWARRPRAVALDTDAVVIEIGLRDLETLVAVDRLSKQGVCRAAYGRIGELQGTCASTAARACRRLADDGFIDMECVYDDRGGQRPNQITITAKGLSALGAVATARACSRKHD